MIKTAEEVKDMKVNFKKLDSRAKMPTYGSPYAAGADLYAVTDGDITVNVLNEANTTTNLLLDDYIVNLPTGSNETRFALSIKPEKTATNVGNIGGTMNDGQGVRKFIIDGKLYLQKDGMLYDAQGHIVR